MAAELAAIINRAASTTHTSPFQGAGNKSSLSSAPVPVRKTDPCFAHAGALETENIGVADAKVAAELAAKINRAFSTTETEPFEATDGKVDLKMATELAAIMNGAVSTTQVKPFEAADGNVETEPALDEPPIVVEPFDELLDDSLLVGSCNIVPRMKSIMYMVSIVHGVSNFAAWLSAFKTAQQKSFSIEHGINATFVGECRLDESEQEGDEQLDESMFITTEDKLLAREERMKAKKEQGSAIFAHVVHIFEHSPAAAKAIESAFAFNKSEVAKKAGVLPPFEVARSKLSSAISHGDPAEAEMMLSMVISLGKTEVSSWRREFEAKGLHKELGLNAMLVGEVPDSTVGEGGRQAHVLHFYPKSHDEAVKLAIKPRRFKRRGALGTQDWTAGDALGVDLPPSQLARSTMLGGASLKLYKFMTG